MRSTRINGRTTLLAAGVLGTLAILGGCDSKDTPTPEPKKSAGSSILDGENPAQSNESAGDLVARYEQAAADVAESSPEEARAYLASAETLKEIQAIVSPYESTIKDFMSLGGLNAKTITDETQFERRVSMVNGLISSNERMATELPPLIARLEASSEPAKLEMKLELLDRLRQADHSMYQSMLGYLSVLQQTWGKYGVDDQGSIQFSPDVEPALIAEFNEYAGNIQAMSGEQAKLQEAIAALDRP